MAARLTDKQKKQIIADYVELGSYNAVAKRHGIADTTVRRIVGADPQMQKNAEHKKEENAIDILAHMETKRDTVNKIIDVYLARLLDPEVIAKATPSQLTTALGTIIDKFTAAAKSVPPNNSENMQSLAELIRNPQPNRNIADFEAVENE